ncbi:MAG: prepilin-type N-terminal cleavage/methylation domain-containing protein [Gemmatimonadota bacterium]|nr:MAG: prepilin-type N-terminal cleavage/methylation domain-containing protein [Gemmatimonadota bacterium]
MNPERVENLLLRSMRSRSGFTLVEVVVVLILLGLAAGLVAPAIIFRDDRGESQLAQLIGGAQDLSARRGEIMHLRVDAGGEWRIEGAASLEEGLIARGRIDDFQGPPFTLVVSPIGTCGFDVRSTEAALAFPVDPLTCELQVAEVRVP